MGRLHLLVRRHDAEVMGCKSPAGRDERNRCNLSLAVCVKAVVSCEFSRVIFRAPIDRVALFLFCREGVKMRKSFEVKTLSITLLAVILLVTPLLAAEFTEQLTLKADELILVNLIGEVTVEQASGSVFVVDVAVRGEDASRDLIQIESDEDRKATVVVNFPTDKERKYVYPKLGRNAKTTITFHGDDHKNNNWLAKLFNSSHRKIKVSGSGSGLEVWADVTVRVPAGKGCVVKHGVGEIKALDVKGDLDLDIHSGPVAARRIEGSLVADTGSGSVTIEQAEGDLNVDTGSGSVVVNQCEGERVSVDTGSGSVKAEDIACDRLVIDTGSGSVRARAVTAEDAKIDTGSGSVKLFLDRMGSGRFVLDTGSGSIELGLPSDASAEVTAETGSGSISVEIEGIHLKKSHKDYVSFTIGDGDARVLLDTGSGSIRIYGQ